LPGSGIKVKHERNFIWTPELSSLPFYSSSFLPDQVSHLEVCCLQPVEQNRIL